MILTGLRTKLSVLLALSFIPAVAYEPLMFPTADISHIGIYIENIPTGKTIVEYNADKVLTPASVMKSVTAASVQSLVKPDFRFTTTVYPAGTITNGTLDGDLIIEGTGDPTLGSRHFADTQPDFVSAVVRHIKTLGIDSIAGDILLDESRIESFPTSPYWLQEDFAWEYGAGYFGINFRDNSFSMSITPVVEPKVSASDVEVRNETRKTGDESITAMRGYDSSVLTITGSIKGKNYASRYSLPSPAIELYNVLTEALNQAGISIGNNLLSSAPVPDKTKAMRYTSPSRDKILTVMMHKSDNLYAEGMLHTLAPKADNAVKREHDLWNSRGISLKGSRWLDGSGLSPVERISPRTLGQILTYMAKTPCATDYVSLFPRTGKEGTVRSMLKDTRLAGVLALKSGSMNGVKCYAGYRIGTDGQPTHTIVIMVNGYACKSNAVTKAIEEYLLDVLP